MSSNERASHGAESNLENMTQATNVNFWISRNTKSKLKARKENVDYLAGIAQNNPRVLKMIYNNYLSRISKFIVENNGSKDDALDVFQDALVIMCKKIQSENFYLTSSFYTFFFSVCRNIWLRELNKRYRQEVSLNDFQEINQATILESCCQEKKNLFESKMLFLSQESRQVLTLFFKGFTMKEIAAEMNYTMMYAQRKKYLAKNQLIKLIQNDRLFQELN